MMSSTFKALNFLKKLQGKLWTSVLTLSPQFVYVNNLHYTLISIIYPFSQLSQSEHQV